MDAAASAPGGESGLTIVNSSDAERVESGEL